MKTLTNSAGSTWEYSYDESGYRTKKKLLNTTYEYMLDGSQVVRMKTPTRTVWFYYDANGQRVALDISGTMYYYIYNLMGDVVGLYDSTGNVVARYAYDAWGRVLTVKDGSGNILNPTANPGEPGIINPFRYRGYMYDDESGLYYLNSRYYDPETGRFVNADGYVSTGQGVLSHNMYAYCLNNPINMIDPNGTACHIHEGGRQGPECVFVGGKCLYHKTTECCMPVVSPSPEPYKSADDAAKAFSEQVYSSSAYIRHEYSTEIYSRTIQGETTYNYNPPRAGTPHSAPVGNSTPKGTTTVAYAHTHPNSNVFSNADIQAAETLRIDAYVVGPNLQLQRYSLLSELTINLGVISPVALTDAQCASLVTEFQLSWDAHVAAGCDFGCNNMTWPTP